ncbi:uncharacterized protein LOC119587758 [Penaeus monodon]|uniref:uncharacterized protein LOC119587758 n=1 Tax=Penaeus monodon TaxID=6687 RepID=UPI0018A7159C|nr:uncharacterized protein LOC119587758 [Penaeus monodon]
MSKRKMTDSEEVFSPWRMNQKNTMHCQGCMCWSLMENGDATNHHRSPITRCEFTQQSPKGRETYARDFFSQRRQEEISTPQKKGRSSEWNGTVNVTPSKLIAGAMEFLDCGDGLARRQGSCVVKEVLCDSGSSSEDDISVQVYSQDEDEDKDEESAIAEAKMEDSFLKSSCGKLELKKTKADRSPRQKGINPLKDIGLLPLGKLPARKSFPDSDLFSRNQSRICQDDLIYNHDQLVERNVNSGPSQCVGKTNEDISQSKFIKDTCQEGFCASKMSMCLTLPQDNTAENNNQCKDLERIHKPVNDHKEQIIKHQCKDSSFVCSSKTTNKYKLDPNKAYELRKTPAQIWEESKVRCVKYTSKKGYPSLVNDPFNVKLDIQATVEASCVVQSSASCETDSDKSLSRERSSSKDRDKCNIFTKLCTNEPCHKHRRLSIDSALSENSVNFCGYKNSCNSDKFSIFARHNNGYCYPPIEQNGGISFAESTDTLNQNALITSPRYKCQKLGYDPHILQSKPFLPGFVDTHCHLDFVFRRSNHDSASHARFQALCQGHDAYPVSFEGCIAVFCQPWTFGKTSWWEGFLKEANVWAAFGCHPHYANFFGEEEEEQLRLTLFNPKVLAVGEIGLDYSGRNNQHPEQQKLAFRRQLKIALEFNKPLVIHCRDAERDCLAILKELVPRNYLIHRHCFTEGWEEAQEWLSAFSNLYLGVTGLVTYPNSERAWRLQDVLRQIPLSRLLLETDAPYFRPYCYQGSGRWSHPGMAIHVAAQVASVRGESIQKVLSYARSNTKMVYGI